MGSFKSTPDVVNGSEGRPAGWIKSGRSTTSDPRTRNSMNIETSETESRIDGGQLLEAHPQDASDETPHATACGNPECEGYKTDGRPLLSFPCWDARQEERR